MKALTQNRVLDIVAPYGKRTSLSQTACRFSRQKTIGSLGEDACYLPFCRKNALYSPGPEAVRSIAFICSFAGGLWQLWELHPHLLGLSNARLQDHPACLPQNASSPSEDLKQVREEAFGEKFQLGLSRDSAHFYAHVSERRPTPGLCDFN